MSLARTRTRFAIGLLLAVVTPAAAFAGDWITLYDGTRGGGSMDGWKMTGPGNFVVDTDGSLRSQGGMGLFYYAEQAFGDFELEVEWRTGSHSANSGVFVRFPEAPNPQAAVDGGYEVQIFNAGSGVHGTGAIYSFATPRDAVAAATQGGWNLFNIRVRGQQYRVSLNGTPVTEFVGDRALRGYVGLQNHDDASTTWFRRVRVRELEPAADPVAAVVSALTSTAEPTARPLRVLAVTATHGFRHTAAIERSTEVLRAIAARSEFEFDFTEDLSRLSPDGLAAYDVLFLNNATLRVDEPDVAQTAGPLTFRPGDWRNYSLRIMTPERDLPVRLALSGDASDTRALVEVEGTVQAISDIQIDGENLRMSWDSGGGLGVLEVQATISEASFDGKLLVGGQPLRLTGEIAAASTQRDWDVANPVTAAQRAAILDFVEQGGGLVGAHSALDAFYGWSAYRDLVGGGLFASHPWTQPVSIHVEDTHNPATLHLGDALQIRDEIYVLDANPRWNSHVLMSLDNTSVGITQGPPDDTRSDFPISWIRDQGDGRVFITKLGHFPDVWTNPAFMQHFLQGVRLAARRLPGTFNQRRVKETIADNVWPDDIAVDERGNVWIAELRGRIHRYDAAQEQTRQIAHLETTDPTKIEHGLLGIEVDPSFYDGEPFVYLYYTEPDTFINTLARYRFDGTSLDLDNGEVLLRVPTEPLCCHQAGDLEWGPDGTLYISTGDTGMSETRPDWKLAPDRIEAFKTRHGLKGHHWSRLVDSERSAQNLQDLRGKILRINPDGTIPSDNPFHGDPGVRWEIFAYGLRNPYRFKVHPQTGKVYIGVVGPDARYDYDEYNVASGGENFGWPRSIGRLFYNEWTPEAIPNYAPPMWEYTYATGARSATVGPIYTYDGNDGFPAIFRDKIFIYDWSRRWIKWASIEEGEFVNDAQSDMRTPPLEVRQRAPRLGQIRDFDTFTSTTPISMELGPDGSVYVAEFDGFWDAGPNSRVSRYRWTTDATPAAAPAGDALSAGERLYQSRCASCHQGDGQGVAGVFPPLVQTRRVLSDTTGLIDVVLNGMAGPIEVKGQSYSGVMAPWRNTLSDSEVATLLSWIRQQWGNDGTAISAAQVAAVRAASSP